MIWRWCPTCKTVAIGFACYTKCEWCARPWPVVDPTVPEMMADAKAYIVGCEPGVSDLADKMRQWLTREEPKLTDEQREQMAARAAELLKEEP